MRRDDVAGLLLGEEGWTIPGAPPAPEGRFDHPTISGELERRGLVLAASWAYEVQGRLPFGVDMDRDGRSFETLDAYLFHQAPVLTWGWWCGWLRDGDTAADLTERGLSAWMSARRVDRSKAWGPDTVLVDQGQWAYRNRSPRLDSRHLPAAAETAGLRLK